MTIAQLIMPLDIVSQEGDLNVEVVHITDDSRLVTSGSLFVAVKGLQADGHVFIDKACHQGAVGIMVQAPFRREGQRRPAAVVEVPDTRGALGVVAARFFADPSLKLNMVGVTGTNGKTTVTHLAKALLETSDHKVGLIGTIGYSFGSGQQTATHTTPDSIALQSLLRKMVDSGLDSAVLEVSSHALALDRVTGCEFDTVVFTNLTQDHLDFHANMQEYFDAKLRLFTELVASKTKQTPKRAIINIDDEWGKRIVEACSVPVWTYAIQQPADIQAREISLSIEGTQFTAVTPRGPIPIQSALVGEHNVYNLLAAIGVGLASGLSAENIENGIQAFTAVPGRFELVNAGQAFAVVVDYAHTDDALARLLVAAKTLRRGRILTVFGCGGDRDRGKRPKMGSVAARDSDLVYLTSDNPRTEDPLAILREIEAGILAVPEQDRATYRVIPDRREAIHAAIHEAQPGDMVLIAGKGHEDYQIVGSERLHFDDREAAREVLAQRVRAQTE